MVELDAGEESGPPQTACEACLEFGTTDTDVGRDEFRSDRPLGPLTPVVFGDFS